MRKIAFLVANDTFPKDPSIPPLRFTQNDARELAAVLEDRETCGFETRVYLNRPSQEVLTDLDQVSGEVGQDDTLLFYYSGHGKLRGNELCLVSNETATTSRGATSIRTRLVLEYLQGSLARRRILVLDCCHSGAIGRVYKAVDSKSTLDGLADSFGSYILTASTSIELAEEREKDGHGVFTKALIDCLREGPKDRITINDLYEYAHARLKIFAQQTPLFWALQQEGTAVEIGNYEARRERERQLERERLERERRQEQERLERERRLEQERLEHERRREREQLISTVRARLGAYVSLRELSEEQVEEAVALLKRDEARLFPRDRRYRDNLIRFSKHEISFLELVEAGPLLRPEPAPKPPENEVSPPITPPDAPVVDAPLTLFEPPAIDQPIIPPEPVAVDQFVTTPEPADIDQPAALSEPPVVYQRVTPPEPAEIGQTIASAEPADLHPVAPPEPPVLDPPVTPVAPEALPGPAGGGELPVVLSPTKALLIFIPAVLAIGVAILAYFVFAPGSSSVRLEDNQKQASLAVTHEESSESVTASPAEKAPSPVIKAPSPVVEAPTFFEDSEKTGEPSHLANYGDWGVFLARGKTSKTCYALATPKDRAPPGLRRDPAYVFISNRPGENVREEVSIIMGFRMKEDGARAEVAGSSFALMAKAANAWIKNTSQEAQFVDALKSGSKLIIRAPSLKGQTMIDSYSLAGLSQALERVQKECP